MSQNVLELKISSFPAPSRTSLWSVTVFFKFTLSSQRKSVNRIGSKGRPASPKYVCVPSVSCGVLAEPWLVDQSEFITYYSENSLNFLFYFKENKLCRYKKLVISSDVLNSLRTYCTIWMNSSVLIWLILVFSFILTDRSLKFTNTVGVHLSQRVCTRMYNVFKTANFNSILLFPEHIVQKTTKKFSAIK